MKTFKQNRYLSGKWRRMIGLPVLLLIHVIAFSQSQTCPSNISFSSGDLSFWSAATGLMGGATQTYPAPNNGVRTIPEYSISTTGIQVISSPGTDLYGGFTTIPTINGYSYGYSIKIGSSSTSWDLHGAVSNPGGFVRSITYVINVPAGPATVPYTMTYAYAMVLENGTHNSNQQPLFKATLNTPDSTISCASPQYYLPTLNDAGGSGGTPTGATLDSAAAKANGFTLSPVLFLSHTGNNNTNGTLLQDVWTKGWTEVTFDLSPYRGKQVTLTFESDNCTPGGHFAYAYVALRNTCAGLEISGNPVACQGNSIIYSVPALANATYNWSVPAGWTINSGANSNSITVTPGLSPGNIIVREVNGCADLKDTLAVSALPGTVPGQVNSDNTVCEGTNSTFLSLSGQTGNILNWISSTDGVSWNNLSVTNNNYTAQNLNTTTRYKAIVQNGTSCKIDTSAAAVITVDKKSTGGVLSPANTNICLGQNADNQLLLTGSNGAILNWERSSDNLSWAGFIPANTGTGYTANNITADVYYRAIVKNGVCPADTSTVAKITFINVPYPDATINPDTAYICYGQSASFSATINTGTSYAWSNAASLSGQGSGTVTGLPYVMNPVASALTNTHYVLTVNNTGCPNSFTDTFRLGVAPPIFVFAGNDTAVVANQPLQLNASVSDPAANIFNWTPSTGLDFTTIPDPVAILPSTIDYITYIVRAANAAGCYGEDTIKVTVFKTGPDLFIPSAFTPNDDGKNDLIYPICVGIRQLNFFRVYNRWGQLVFSTSRIGQGWDGRINGTIQNTGNFVYVASAIDYTGRAIFKKGNIVLIR